MMKVSHQKPGTQNKYSLRADWIVPVRNKQPKQTKPLSQQLKEERIKLFGKEKP